MLILVSRNGSLRPTPFLTCLSTFACAAAHLQRCFSRSTTDKDNRAGMKKRPLSAPNPPSTQAHTHTLPLLKERFPTLLPEKGLASRRALPSYLGKMAGRAKDFSMPTQTCSIRWYVHESSVMRFDVAPSLKSSFFYKPTMLAAEFEYALHEKPRR